MSARSLERAVDRQRLSKMPDGFVHPSHSCQRDAEAVMRRSGARITRRVTPPSTSPTPSNAPTPPSRFPRPCRSADHDDVALSPCESDPSPPRTSPLQERNSEAVPRREVTRIDPQRRLEVSDGGVSLSHLRQNHPDVALRVSVVLVDLQSLAKLRREPLSPALGRHTAGRVRNASVRCSGRISKAFE